MDNQYRIIAAQAGWADRSTRGRIQFAGADAISFLQALLTNDVSRLTRGQGAYAAYLTPQGRMIADISILHRGEWLFGSVAPGLGATLATRFDSLIFSEDLVVTDVTSQWAEIDVTGGDVVARLARALVCDHKRLAELDELSQEDCGSGFIVRAGASPFPMFTILVPAGDRENVIARLEETGIVPIPPELAAALRIEAGRSEWGTDLTTETIPLEAGLLDRAISTSKGCYVGQEIIIRILHRAGGRVAKRLAVLSCDPAATEVPAAGTPIVVDGRDVGHVTSAASSPDRGRIIALGYVHRDAAEVGRRLQLADPAGPTAEITGFAV